MNIEETLNVLFWNSAEVTTLPSFILSMTMTAILGLRLAQVYIRFGQSLSNRKSLARNFLMLALTTTLIITIVKSSLALSLGLVGALSIVRFRAAIKEPEELTYLFLAIALGLGMGANQPIITTVAFFMIVAIIIVLGWVRSTPAQPNLYVTVSSPDPDSLSASQLLTMLKNVGASAGLKRSDIKPDVFEASFLVNFEDVESFEKFAGEVKTISPKVNISCMDNYGITA